MGRAEVRSPFKEGGLFDGADPLVFAKAKELRKNMTHAETVLWHRIKAGIEGFKVRRQHPVAIYIAGFYCHQLKLIIEVDGSIHNKEEIKKYDEQRQKDLEGWGYFVIRFTNDEVISQTDAVVEKIKNTVAHLIIINKKKAPRL